MDKALAELTPERARILLDYDALTGILIWRARPIIIGARQANNASWNARFAGTQSGRIASDGSIQTNIGGRRYANHRLAWAHYYGEWPPDMIDHINRCRTDNRIANLRMATVHENNRNLPLQKRNTSGVKGVSWSNMRQKWVATIGVNKRLINLGRFVSKTDAIAVRQAAARHYFGEFASETPLDD